MPATEEDYKRMAEANERAKKKARKSVGNAGEKKREAKLAARAKKVNARIAKHKAAIQKRMDEKRARKKAKDAEREAGRKRKKERREQEAEHQRARREAKEGARRDYTEGEMCLYFVEGAGLIKIGVTVDLDKRLKNLRAGCPVELVLLGDILGSRALEAKLHKKFASACSHGEWFQGTDELREYIAEVTDV